MKKLCLLTLFLSSFCFAAGKTEPVLHDDYKSGEAGFKAGLATYESVSGKKLPQAPTYEERMREKLREAGRDAKKKQEPVDKKK